MQELVTFRTVDPAGADVYHTNVMMAIGTVEYMFPLTARDPVRQPRGTSDFDPRISTN